MCFRTRGLPDGSSVGYGGPDAVAGTLRFRNGCVTRGYRIAVARPQTT